MAYKVIILYRLYMPSYFLGTFTEYPLLPLVITLKTKGYFIFEAAFCFSIVSFLIKD